MQKQPLPKPPTDSGAHHASAEALQKWLWQCTAAGWDPLGSNSGIWTHDDNMAVQHLGWMIVKPPGSDYHELFVLRQGHPSHMMKRIIDAAPIDPLCAKAVALLGKQRVLYPNIKFSYMEH